MAVFTPLEILAIYGRDKIFKFLHPIRKSGVKALSFLTGFTSSEKKLFLFLCFSFALGSILLPLKSTSPNAAVFPAPIKININLADEVSLARLNGVGPALARRIIEHRNSRGKFSNAEELKKVKGIGEKKFQKLKDSVVAE